MEPRFRAHPFQNTPQGESPWFGIRLRAVAFWGCRGIGPDQDSFFLPPETPPERLFP